MKKIISTVFIYLELIIMAVIVIYPVIWIIGSSFNPFNMPSGTIIPDNPTLENYKTLFTKTKFTNWYLNTLIVAVATMVLAVIVNTFTAFIFARYPFKGRKPLLVLLMILQMFPSFLGLVAIYMIALNFNLLNNLFTLVIVYVAGSIPGNIFIVRGYMLGIPKSLDEAAFMDGATKLQIFTKIIFPLSVPIISFMAVTAFMSPWMDYMMPRYIISSDARRTVAVGLFQLIRSGPDYNFPAFAAGAVLIALPITVLYVVLQRFLLEGLTAGANKGE